MQALEAGNINKLSPSVKLFVRIFVFIALSGKSHSDSGWGVLDPGSPNELVQFRVNSDIFGSHGLLCKLSNFLDRSRCSILELLLVYALRQVDGVIPSYQVGLGGRRLDHFLNYCCDLQQRGESVSKGGRELTPLSMSGRAECIRKQS